MRICKHGGLAFSLEIIQVYAAVERIKIMSLYIHIFI